MTKSNRFWLCLFAALLLFSVLAAALISFLPSQGSTAVIYVNGEQVAEIELSQLQEPYELSIGGNRILATNEGIAVIEADCKDQSCVRQGMISDTGMPIVCLPNRLVVQIEHGEASEFDAVSS